MTTDLLLQGKKEKVAGKAENEQDVDVKRAPVEKTSQGDDPEFLTGRVVASSQAPGV